MVRPSFESLRMNGVEREIVEKVVEIQIRKALPEDVVDACNVLCRSITEACRLDHHDDPEILAKWLQNKTPDQLRPWLNSPEGQGFVAVVDGRISGFGYIGYSGLIYLLYILPEVLHQGVGKRLLQTMIQIAKAGGVEKVYLESTPSAKPFYERNGFVSDGEPVQCSGILGYPMARILK